MHSSRLAIAGLALVASTIMISCGSDNNSNPTDTGNTPAVGDTTLGSGSTVGGAGTLPIADTIAVDTVETTAP
jgi:hypothetical protein